MCEEESLYNYWYAVATVLIEMLTYLSDLPLQSK